jgi:hypothetical protein
MPEWTPDRVEKKKILTYETLNAKKQAYVDAYLKHGDKYAAYLDAGYKPSKRSYRSNAYQMYRELQGVIYAEIDKRIGSGAITALSAIKELMQTAESEIVRLSAAKDYLQRAGYDKLVETKLTVEDFRGVQDKDIKEEIEALLGKAVNEPGPRSVES